MQSRGSVLISRQPAEVFAFISDPANDHRWRGYLVSSRGHVVAEGDHVTQTFGYEGKNQTIDLTVTEYKPPERLSYVMHEPTRARFGFQCRPEAGGTRVSMSVSATVPGPAALFEGRIQSEADRLIKTDLERLKRALDAAT